jgi:hypothetical protein
MLVTPDNVWHQRGHSNTVTGPKTRHLQRVYDAAASEVQTPENRYISDRMLCDRYGISEATLLRWRREGKYPKAISLVPGGPNRTSMKVVLDHESSRAVAPEKEYPLESIKAGRANLERGRHRAGADTKRASSARSRQDESRTRVLDNADA